MLNEKSVNQLMLQILEAKSDDIINIIEDIHPEDFMDALRHYEGDKVHILNKLPEPTIVEIIEQAEDDEKIGILELLPLDKQQRIINEMASDELVDMLGIVTPDEANEIFIKIDQSEKEELIELLSYDPHTAGGIMATEFISIKTAMNIDETLAYLREEAPEAETAYYVYVLDEEDRLKGVVSLRDIVISNFEIKIEEIVNENVISIPVDMDQEEVGHIFEKYGFLTMPVIDEERKMLGIITVDDILEILRDETTEDMYRLAGLQEGEQIESSIWDSLKKRLPWLFVNLFTAIAAAATVNMFSDTIGKAVALAAFMPIVAGMGGNTGTQTLTIVVRAIALGELTSENAKSVLLKEIGVGISTGLSIGIAVALIGFIWVGNYVFGLVIGLAMLLNLTIATSAGFIVPITLKRMNIDPALASSVFVTTVTDVLGFFFFLGLATLFIAYLI